MTLRRFHDAQTGAIDTAIAELRAGRKRTHWMWFVFPQIAGLGQSPTARHFALRDLPEARAYLADPVLSGHLTRAADALLSHPDRSAAAILGEVDALKLRSSATLFEAAGERTWAGRVLYTFHGGRRCDRTLAILTDVPPVGDGT